MIFELGEVICFSCRRQITRRSIMVNYSETKSKLQLLYSLLDSVEENGGKPSDINTSLRNVFKRDLQTFLTFLSAADGKISTEIRAFMNFLFDSNIRGGATMTSIYGGMSPRRQWFLIPFFLQPTLTARQMVFFDRSASATTSRAVMGSRPRWTHSTVA